MGAVQTSDGLCFQVSAIYHPSSVLQFGLYLRANLRSSSQHPGEHCPYPGPILYISVSLQVQLAGAWQAVAADGFSKQICSARSKGQGDVSFGFVSCHY